MPMMGECPYECGHSEMRLIPGESWGDNAFPDRPLPCFGKENCNGCGKPLWIYYSRWDPRVYTEEDFRAAFTVDEATKVISERAKPSTERPEGTPPFLS